MVEADVGGPRELETVHQAGGGSIPGEKRLMISGGEVGQTPAGWLVVILP